MLNMIDSRFITDSVRRNNALIYLSLIKGSSALPDRFWGQFCEVPSGCWEWRGRRDRSGYGRFGAHGTRGTNLVHRLAYLDLVGPIPRGLELDHLCRNRACGNVEHLEPVTHRENLKRGSQGTQTHCIHGHELSGDNLKLSKRKNGDDFRQCRACLARRNRECAQRKAGAA